MSARSFRLKLETAALRVGVYIISNVYVISNVVVIACCKLRCNVEINVEASFVVVVKASLPEVNAIVFPAPFSPLR